MLRIFFEEIDWILAALIGSYRLLSAVIASFERQPCRQLRFRFLFPLSSYNIIRKDPGY